MNIYEIEEKKWCFTLKNKFKNFKLIKFIENGVQVWRILMHSDYYIKCYLAVRNNFKDVHFIYDWRMDW